MIYLIGGAPRLGKSILARELMKRSNVSWVSTDALRSAFYEVMDPAVRDKLLPLEAGVPDSLLELHYSTNEVVAMQWKELETMAPGIKAFLLRHHEQGDPLILEGGHLLPTMVAELRGAIGPDLHAIYLVNSDEISIFHGIKNNSSPSDWLKDFDDSTKMLVAKVAAGVSTKIENEAKRLGIKAVPRTEKFIDDIETAIKAIS